MPECAVCGSGDFDLFDGLYFCTDCGTQSQDAREEVAEEEVDGSRGSFIKEIVASKKAQRQALGSDDVVVNITSLEKYQKILQKQADALISLGFDPSVKSALRLIWFHYLKCFGYAFTEGKPVQEQVWKQKSRGKRRLGGIRPGTKKKCTKKSTKKKQTAKKRKVEGEFDVLPSDEHLFESSEEEEEEEEEQEEEVTGEALHLKRKALNTSNDVTYFSAKITLSLLYLSLLFCKQQFLPVDLVRWARQGKIPYHNLYRFLPRSYAAKSADRRIMHVVTTMSADTIIWNAQLLVHRMSLPLIPSPSAAATCKNLCQRLALPVLFQRLVDKSLLHLHSPHFNKGFMESKYSRRFDAECLATILLLLRVLYRPDASCHTQDPPTISMADGDQPAALDLSTNALYVWEDWMELFLRHRKQTSSDLMPISAVEFRRMTDHSKYFEDCRELFTMGIPPPQIASARKLHNPKLNKTISDVFGRYSLKAKQAKESKAEEERRGEGGREKRDASQSGTAVGGGAERETGDERRDNSTTQAFVPRLVALETLLANVTDYATLMVAKPQQRLSTLQLPLPLLFLVNTGADLIDTSPELMYHHMLFVEGVWLHGQLTPLLKLRGHFESVAAQSVGNTAETEAAL